jgi:hypothetical protein
MQGSNAPQERPNSSHKQGSSAADGIDGNGQPPSPPDLGSTPQATDWPEYERRLEASKQLVHVQVEEVRLEWMEGTVKARLRERKVELWLKVLVVLTAIGLSVALFIASPAFFSLSLLVGGSVALRRLRKPDGHGSGGSDPEGDP